MRRLLLLLVLPLLPLLLPLLLAAPAGAGGPTSVLVTDPSTGRATALYYSDPAYEELRLMLADGERLSGRPDDLGSRTVNLTWMIHDVQPWQVEQLHLDAEGGPVVAITGTETMGAAGRVTWLRPAEGKALLQLVDRVLAGAPAPAAAAPAETPAPEPAVVEKVVTETAWWSLSGWRWAVPGLLLGAGLASVAMRRSRARDAEPRQVLVDA